MFCKSSNNSSASLSEYLNTVQEVIRVAFDEPVWVKAEIRNLSIKGGHYYLELAEKEEDTDKVNLLTLHASKGLEFPFVYIMGLEEELLPHKNSIAAETIEEERRLMYVGITRAQQGLTLTLAEQRKNGGQMKQMTPSRFLDELPQDDLDWLGRKKKLSENIDPKLQAQHYLQNLKALLKK